MAKLWAGGKNVRLFPLGGLVFFPHSRLPLRIFEPRYRQMTEDALAADREIAMILPRQGPSEEPVPIHQVGTLGTIHNERKLPNGEYLLELHGVHRIRIIEEVHTVKMYRQARVEVIEDEQDPHLETLRELQRSEIIRHLVAILPESNEAVTQYLDFLGHHCDPATFSDVVAYSSPIAVEVKQSLLEEPNVDRRLEIMVETAHAALAGMVPDTPPGFPPEFSSI